MRSSSDGNFNALVGNIYDAALNVGLWPAFLKSFMEDLAGHQASIYRINTSDCDGNVYADFGLDPTFRHRYDAYFGRINPIASAVVARESTEFRTIDHLGMRKDYINSEFFSDWVRPQRCAEFMTASLDRKSHLITGITVLRGRRLFTERERTRCNLLLPHLRRALEVHSRLGLASVRADALSAALEQVGIGVAVVTDEAELVFANAEAERTFSGRYGLRVRGRRIVAEMLDAEAILLRSIRSATDPARGEASSAVLGLKSASCGVIPLLICPMRRGLAALGSKTPLALIVFGGKRRRSTRRDELIETLALTPAEAQLLGTLVDGGTLIDHARIKASSPETVRSQMRSILKKTGTHRQVDAVRRVLDNPVLSRP